MLECHNELTGHTCLWELEDVYVRLKFLLFMLFYFLSFFFFRIFLLLIETLTMRVIRLAERSENG